mgnify:CR=1 FL=1
MRYGAYLQSKRLPRVNGNTLQRIRREWFALHPLCVRCTVRGRVTLATQLDHIVALENGGEDFDVDQGRNRQGLCEDCHKEKTREDLGQKPRPRIGTDGYPEE